MTAHRARLTDVLAPLAALIVTTGLALLLSLGSPTPARAAVAPEVEARPVQESSEQSGSGANGEQEQEQQGQRPVDDPTPEQGDLQVRERIMVVGDASGIDLIPGSVHLLRGAELQARRTPFDDVHSLLRGVPGVNIQEEEGYGLRPNIGFRGSGSERSARITLMEDGVLIAPAPYAAPAAYYFPTTGRMEAIEVRKGSSQVKFGPRTTGGALNLVSTGVPATTRIHADLAYGTDNTVKGYLNAGGSGARWGWLVETYQLRTDGFKRVDGGGDTGFVLRDFLGKLRYRTDAAKSTFQELELKVGYTDQDSDETYLGLTSADFRADPTRRYAGSQGDRLESEHRQLQLRHFAALGPRLDLTTVAYRNDFRRDWYKIQSVEGVAISTVMDNPAEHPELLAILRGADSAPDAITQRHNNRDYYSHGVQSVLGLRLEGDSASQQLELGARYHVDREDRFQSDDGFQMQGGIKTLTSIGTPGSQSNRVSDASALALFAQDRIATGAWMFTPGVRFESIGMTRADYARADPHRVSPTRVRDSRVNVLVPGIGVAHRVDHRNQAFAGVHRGFAPPGAGADDRVKPETSVNYELGFRHRSRHASVEVVGFFTDYENLLGTDTLSSGGGGTGDQFNGGRARVWGLELSGSHDLADTFGWSDASLPLAVSYTWTRGKFLSSFESDFDPWGSVEAGDELPYLAEHLVNVSIGFHRGGWGVFATLDASSPMRTEAGHGPIPTHRGTDAYTVVNLMAQARLSGWAVLRASVQNLFDRSYIVARRPAGARPGLPRTLMVGLRLER